MQPHLLSNCELNIVNPFPESGIYKTNGTTQLTFCLWSPPPTAVLYLSFLTAHKCNSTLSPLSLLVRNRAPPCIKNQFRYHSLANHGLSIQSLRINFVLPNCRGPSFYRTDGYHSGSFQYISLHHVTKGPLTPLPRLYYVAPSHQTPSYPYFQAVAAFCRAPNYICLSITFVIIFGGYMQFNGYTCSSMGNKASVVLVVLFPHFSFRPKIQSVTVKLIAALYSFRGLKRSQRS